MTSSSDPSYIHCLTVCEHVQALAVATSVAAEAGYGGYGGAAASDAQIASAGLCPPLCAHLPQQLHR